MAQFARVVLNLPLPGFFTYRIPEQIKTSISPGLRVKINFNNRLLTGFIHETGSASQFPEVAKSGDKIKDILSLVDETPLLTKELWELAVWMSEYYFCTLGEAFAAILPLSGSSKARKPALGFEHAIAPFHELTSEQQSVFARITPPAKDEEKLFLLHGVTGSGKTEIYLHAMKSAINNGKSAILLVPEISLTTQILDSVLSHFPSDIVSILHSKLTAVQKTKEWKDILAGKKKIVIGPRSAVFAPLQNLGIIIIDEEQSASYKEHGQPRYHARQIAFMRAKQNRAILLLGSATPSAESYHLALSGRYELLRLQSRYNAAPMPTIKLVRREPFKGLISTELAEAVRLRLSAKEQVVIFHDRRGFASSYICSVCGHAVQCPNCSISLTFHKKGGKDKLACHYCGHESVLPDKCPHCGSEVLYPAGIGTQKVESILTKLFPDSVIQRMDTDSTRKKHSSERMYRDFLEGRTDILVGTQMVSKGLHFPNVTLVGVIGFDAMVSLPDFRSLENTYDLLVQVSGRPGRGTTIGEVLVQTSDLDHPVLKHLINHDFKSFITEELEARKELLYPPFARIIRILIRGRDETMVMKAIEGLGKSLMDNKRLFQALLGPVPAPLTRLNGQFRSHIILKFMKRTEKIAKIIQKIQGIRLPRGLFLEIDPDPLSLL